MIWDNLRGHAGQVAMFNSSIRKGRLSHAYLFAGPDGIGKKRFARMLAQCLMCSARNAHQGLLTGDEPAADAGLDACGQCAGCKQVAAGSHPDLFVVGRPEGKSALPIEVFVGPKERRGKAGLCYELSLRPMAGQRRIAIIDDTELMNAESANALLKTLEEPPPHSLLILVANNVDGLLPTIRSRCQLVRFGPLDTADVAELLVELDMVQGADEARTIAALSDGSLTVAGQLLDPTLRLARETLYDHLANEKFNPLAAANQMISVVEELGGELVTQRQNAVWLIRFCLEFYRMALLNLSGDRAPIRIAQVENFVARFNPDIPEDIELVMELFERAALAEDQLNWKTAIPLCLEAMFHDLARISRAATV